MKAATDAPAITLNQATASGRNAPNKEQVPLTDVPAPGNNDVLSGRGVTTNKHPGNVNFRSLVALNKELYVTSTKKQKMAISRSIVEAVRSMNPPGRFLDKNPETGLWSDIGDRKAVEKTSQALRDGAATLRKQLSEDLGDPDFLSAVFETDTATTTATPAKGGTVRSDGSVSSTSSEARKLCRPRLMKSKMAKKGHRRTKSVPQGAPETKKVQKRARLDQVVPHVPESTPSSQSAAKKPAMRNQHARSSSLVEGKALTPPKQHLRTASAGAAPSKPPLKPEITYSTSQEEEFLEGLGSATPWDVGHSRNSSASSNAMALPPFFPLSPIGRAARPGQGQQHIFSCFQEPKGGRPPISPMHRSWSPRDFPEPFHWRQSVGGATCFSEGDIDIPSLDRAFDRTFERAFVSDDRAFALEDDPILSMVNDDEINAAAPMADGSERIRSSRTSTPSNRDGAADDMELNYSPTLDCEIGGKNDLGGADDLDVIMKDSEPLSPLPFIHDGKDTVLLDNLDLLSLPIGPLESSGGAKAPK